MMQRPVEHVELFITFHSGEYVQVTGLTECCEMKIYIFHNL